MAGATRLQARLSLNILVVISLASALFWWLSPKTAPGMDEAETAAVLLKDAMQPGDALLLSPHWAEAARRALPEALPVLSLPPDDPDLAWPGRLWVLTFPTLAGGEVDETLATLAGRFGAPQVDQRINRTRLLRFTPRGPRPDWRLTEAIPTARVTLGGRPCTWRPAAARSARFQCPAAPWSYVGAQVREIDYLPRECVWAHPVTGRPLRIEVPAVPAGRRMELRAGIVGSMALRRDDAPVKIALRRGPARLGQLRVEPKPGWQSLTFREPPSPAAPEAPPPPPLVLEITTERDGGRHLCLELLAFEKEAAR